MTDINTNNLIKISDGVAVAGQRVIVINGVAHASGLGGRTAPTGGNSEGSALDLSFITAAAGDILSGKVGADREGNPVYGTLVPAQGGGSGGFDLARVTQYTPATEAYSALSQIVISELGYIGDEENDEGGDYSSANGTYFPTPGTATETDPIKRVYKHESADWYIWCTGYRNDEGYVEEPWWYLGPTPDSGAVEILDDGVYDNDGELGGGTVWLMESDWGYESMCQLTVTKVNYPKTDMVLRGVMATGYANGEWSFSETETDFFGAESVPKIGFTYPVFGNTLIGNYIDTKLLALGFDNTDVLADSSPFSHIVTRESGGVFTSEGSSGNVWNFNGGFLKIEPKGGEFVFGASDFTIEANIYPTSDRRQCFFSYWRDGKFSICFSYDGDCKFSVLGSAHGWNVHSVSNSLELNKWYHLAFVRRGNTLYCYVDGKVTGTANMTNVNVNVDHQMAVSFGRWGDDPGDFDARWQGYMDNIRISSVARY